MSRYRGVLFDKDGTLFDFAATWEAWAGAFLLRITGQDRARAQQIGAQIGFDLAAQRFSHDSIVIAGTAGEVAEALLPHLPGLGYEALLDVLNAEAEAAPQAETVPLRPFLEGLRARGLRLGVATNDAEAPARAHLNSAGITDLFDFIAGFDSGHGGKPQPGQMHAFAAATGLAARDVVMVGDSRHDLVAGRAAGMTPVAVLTGLATRADLAPLADAVLDDIGHLPDWLAAQG
ncbi:HAD family hydrolase [Sulfitobacter sabulilitoris]|uniref:phosphoglycolate phosphatase n=1 Tax=Sulfitobacter sabulilitoris TaxID=2562655 RepID=A0A5S3PRF1_9RHOB|nr:HAD family hydrolase [Sulfitobacter sabulilitoris]TMM55135.1 HAD family hydrolase [Sulfitobacter sabulilitoris]